MKINELLWSNPFMIEDIRKNRSIIPYASGVYVFTTYGEKMTRNTGVLYIGKAKTLRIRLSTYLSSPFSVKLLSPKKRDNKISRSLRHTGKNLLLMEIQQKSRYGQSGIWLRWHKTINPAPLEKELIEYYQPAFNVSLNPRAMK